MAKKISNKKYADIEEGKVEVKGIVEKDESQELSEKKPKATRKKKVVDKPVEKKAVKKTVKGKEVVVSDTIEPVKPKRKYTRKKKVEDPIESAKPTKKTPSEFKVDKVLQKKLFIEEKLAKKERVIKEAMLMNNVDPVEQIDPKELTLKDIYNQFILDGDPFKIYHKGSILFDSKLHINMPIMTDEHIIVFGKNYIYRGIQFTKY